RRPKRYQRPPTSGSCPQQDLSARRSAGPPTKSRYRACSTDTASVALAIHIFDLTHNLSRGARDERVSPAASPFAAAQPVRVVNLWIRRNIHQSLTSVGVHVTLDGGIKGLYSNRK